MRGQSKKLLGHLRGTRSVGANSFARAAGRMNPAPRAPAPDSSTRGHACAGTTIANPASNQPVALEETFGDFLGRLLVDVDAGVELGHRLVVELGGDRVERVGDFRVLVQNF